MIGGGTVYGQSPFPVSDAIWQTREILIFGPTTFFYETCGDTTSTSKVTYQKFFQFAFDQEGKPVSRVYVGGTRVESNKVWLWLSGAETETLLYDFGLQEGQTISLQDFTGNPVELTVDSTRTVSAGGQDRKAIYFTPLNENSIAEVWIEGIGSNRGPLTRAHRPTADFEPFLTCFKQPGLNYQVEEPMEDCRLSNLEFCDISTAVSSFPSDAGRLRVFPNPFVEKLTFSVAAPPKAWRVELRNFAGKIVYSGPAEGPEKQVVISHAALASGIYAFLIINEVSNTVMYRGKVVRLAHFQN